MITSVKIERLRGVKEGEVNNLTPLTVLVGGNGSGKSTVLEAILIGASPKPHLAVGYASARRVGVQDGFRWLFWKHRVAGVARIVLLSEEDKREVVISCEDGKVSYPDPATSRSAVSHVIPPNPLNAFPLQNIGSPVLGIERVHLLEPYASSYLPLDQMWSDLKREGEHQFAIDVIKAIVPDLDTLDVLTDNGQNALYNTFKTRGKGSVPVALSGDGVHALVRLSLELSLARGGVILFEEPEVHLHFRAMRLAAKVMWAAIERNIQVILTTHSLEFIDALLEARPDNADVNALSIVRTNLIEGNLLTRRYSGEEALFARHDIQDDLR